jgi:hypothetical protein
LLLQFVGLRDRQEFIDGVQPREIVTFPSIEKSFLPDVDVEEAQQRTTRSLEIASELPARKRSAATRASQFE